ncbi:MAG: type 4a pilus biogenesis protein PilO [Candidatus Sungbacteria bacterium]|nr:type 4a pilus biogenesis protein PilO [Candidatus Sungbacteria bacterium]
MPRLLITIILLFGTAVLGLFYLAPQWQNFRSLREDLTALGGISAEFDTLIQNRDALLNLINSVSADNLDRIDLALPNGVNAADFLVSLERMAAESNLVLRRIDLSSTAAPAVSAGGQPRPGGAPVSIPKGGGINEFPVGISISGTYGALKEFLSDLEKNLRLIDVENISFVSPEKESALDIAIKAKTYYQ